MLAAAVSSSLGLSLLLLPPPALAARPPNAILLSDVRSLTLRGNGAKTTHRRAAAIPQLRCLSPGPLCRRYPVDRMRCLNQGSSYGPEDVEWSCTAELDEDVRLGATDVLCEGYASPDDPYVLKGSCGVEYRLVLTAKGEASHPDLAASYGSSATDWSAWLFYLVFVAVLACIVYSACFGNNGRRRSNGAAARRGGGGGGGGGGGWWNPGWGPDDDPPPPYPGPKPYATQQGWTPGFWSGLMGGAAAGYMAGGRRQNNATTGPYAGSWGSPPSSAWRNSPPPSGSGGGPSRHESTGFGSTRRR